MKLAVICLIAGGLVIADTAAEVTIRIKAGNSALPQGTIIEVSLGSDGCDCRAGRASGKTDSRGYVTVILRSDCQSIDIAKCKAVARAEVTSGGVKIIYKGSAKLTQTTSGPYVSTVILVP